MKKVLIISVSLILVILAALIAIPFVFKGKIIEVVKTEANKSLNATVDFSDVSLSLIRSFPDMSLRIENLSVAGVDEFSADTLANLPDFRVTINLMSIFRGSEYELKTITMVNPRFTFRVLADGRANWDIVKPSADTSSAAGEEPSKPFKAAFKRFIIINGAVRYADASLPMDLVVNGINAKLSGDMTADVTNLKTDITATDVTADYGGVRYLSKASASIVSDIEADLLNWKFTFPDAAMMVNELQLTASGYFAMPENGYDMDITFGAAKNDFRSFLSLIPAVYTKDFASVKTDGSLALKGFVKGLYSETTMPGFGVDLQVSNAMFRYPGLPDAVENINMDMSVQNNTGDPDATVIEVKRLHLEMGKNPVDLTLLARTPVSDPFVDLKLKGKLNLADVAKFYPLEPGDQLSGLLDADVLAKGNLSAIEQGRYSDFNASGGFNVTGLVYQTAAVAQKIEVQEAVLVLSPAKADLPALKASIGRNDINASGRLDNLLAYAFGKADLSGFLNLSSSYFNLNDFMTTSEETTATADTSSIPVMEVPGGIDFVMSADFAQLVYDNMDLKEVKGSLKVKDKTLWLENLRMKTLEGQIAVNGSYNTTDIDKPAVDFALDIKDVDIKQAFATFATMEKLAPVAGLASGKISTLLTLKTDLDGNMNPVFSSINGTGKLMSPSITLSNVNSLTKIADALKIDKLKQWVIEKINLTFDIKDGKVFVKPFNANLGKSKAEISGWNSFDETMEYVMQLQIPRSEFGGAANNVLNNLISEANARGANFSAGETIPVVVLIGGTIRNPVITTSLKTAATGAVEDMKMQVKETIQEKKEEAVQKVKEEAGKYIEEANARAQKILDDASARAADVMRIANESATKVNAEADKQAAQLIAEGKKKGTIGELAAKKAAEKVKKEAAEKSAKIVAEAQKQSDNILAKAREESDKIIQEAKNKAE
jgi:hypothetical protein